MLSQSHQAFFISSPLLTNFNIYVLSILVLFENITLILENLEKEVCFLVHWNRVVVRVKD
jgi:hypothetical protein